ncbi:MAG TPA: hypothetical protein VJT50_07835, partial [Pyrinomonadaceae bacterium]|nr:hypothetical protein [Pyrinomonadaceae bacterium]
HLDHLRMGQAANMSVANGAVIGSIGALSETINSDYKFKQPVFVAELNLTALFEVEARGVRYQPLPRYPSVVRDVTLLVSRSVSYDQLVDEIRSTPPVNFRGVELVGTYEGEKIPADKRSITLRIEYRSESGTLRDEEIETDHRELIDRLLEKFAALLH